MRKEPDGSLNKEAIQYLSSFARKIEFGDVEVTEINHVGSSLTVEGRYTAESLNENHEMVAEDMLDTFIRMYREGLQLKPEDSIDYTDEVIAWPIASAMIHSARALDAPEEIIEIFQKKLNNRCDLYL